MMDTGTLGNMQSSISKNKFEKLVNLVGFILTMSRPFRFVTKNLYLRPISPRCATLYTHLPGVLHSTHISQVCYTLHTSPRCATLYTHLPGVLHSTHISQVCYTIHTSPPAGLIAVKLIWKVKKQEPPPLPSPRSLLQYPENLFVVQHVTISTPFSNTPQSTFSLRCEETKLHTHKSST